MTLLYVGCKTLKASLMLIDIYLQVVICSITQHTPQHQPTHTFHVWAPWPATPNRPLGLGLRLAFIQPGRCAVARWCSTT